MKKWLLGFGIVLLLLLASIYIFIPSNLQISKTVIIHCSENGINRFLGDENKWELWWPKENNQPIKKDSSFLLNSFSYRISQKLLSGASIIIEQNQQQFTSGITLIRKTSDSTVMNWECFFNASKNPLVRISQYQEAINIKKNMSAILESFRLFSEKNENIYGMSIVRTSTVDTNLIVAKYTTKYYPGTEEIYHYFDHLREYIKEQKANETGSPMLNVTSLSAGEYGTMVAIPIDKKIPENKDLFFRRMVPGYFMVTETKGGPYTINNALDKMQLFFDDYRKTSMAIPFQYLITDRMKEKDTTKWVTKIYAPVMN
jgi:hypothetical protein